jgi:hypothetical protein
VFQDADSGYYPRYLYFYSWIHVLLTTASGLFYRVCLDPFQPLDHLISCFYLNTTCFMSHAVDLDTLVVSTTDAKILQLDCPRDCTFIYLLKIIQWIQIMITLSMN